MVLGAVVQGISGVGGGFLIVPLLALIDVAFLPGPFILASISIASLMAWRERRSIDARNLSVLSLGILAGGICGAWLLSAIDPARMGLIFGVAVLGGVLLSATGLHLPLNRLTAAVVGWGGGFMGAVAGFGAPALALLYHRESGPKVRSTLAILYLISSVLIVAALAAFGRMGVTDLRYAAYLVPGFVAGYLVSLRMSRHFDTRGMRYIILGVSGAAAVTLIVSSF